MTHFIFYLINVFIGFINNFDEKNNITPPNIFIYISDDQNQWDYGTYGNPEVSTSASDKLAKDGIKFNPLKNLA